MKLSKKILVSGMLFITAAVFAFADDTASVQKTNKKESETSVEEEYLRDPEGDIIQTLAESDDYDNKLVALQYLSDALESGNTSPAVLQALDRLAGEGITSQSRTNGRMMNNFPEIRRQACLLMAKVPTEHSKNMLVSIAVADNEPMVISAAVKSLGDIGINNNDETVDAIAFANRRNQVLNPTSSLAMEVLNAYEALEGTTENKKTMVDSIARIASDYRYVTPVRQRAQKLLKKFTQNASSSNDKKSTKSNTNKSNNNTSTAEVDGE